MATNKRYISLTRPLMSADGYVSSNILEGPWDSLSQLETYCQSKELEIPDGVDTKIKDANGNITWYLRSNGNWVNMTQGTSAALTALDSNTGTEESNKAITYFAIEDGKIKSDSVKKVDVPTNVVTIDTSLSSDSTDTNVPSSKAVYNSLAAKFNANGTGVEEGGTSSNNTASGANSHAEGYGTTASGYVSHAEGSNSVASSSDSHAEGSNSYARGVSSHAEGSATLAYESCSHAEGSATLAYGPYAHSEGGSTLAYGAESHAEGGSSYDLITISSYDSDTKTIVFKENLSNETFSICYLNYNNAFYSVSSIDTTNKTIILNNNLSYDSTNTSARIYYYGAFELYSHVEGFYTTTLNATDHHGTHAEGEYTVASNASHSEGGSTLAIGDYSHAEGYSSTASGDYSHAEGYHAEAVGTASHAEGEGTLTTNTGEHAEGLYNKSSKNLTIHSVGIGSDSVNRANAFEIDVDGNVYIKGIGGYDGTNMTTTGVTGIASTTVVITGTKSDGTTVTYTLYGKES